MSAGDDIAAILGSGLFDLAWLRQRWPDCPGDPREAVARFLERGSGLGLDPGPGFSVRRYLRANPDVAAAGMDALVHYVRHGRGEGRACYPAGDGDDPPVADAAQCERDAALLRTTALFDADFYRDSYPDVAAAGVDLLEHYVRHGAAEGRWPNPYFDTHWYRLRYQSRNDPANPLAHYAGDAPASAARATSGRFDGAFYRARYPDAAASSMTSLEHFLRHGLEAGRLPSPAWAERPTHLVDPREVRATVIVPVHDAAAHVAACLDSVLRHTGFGGADSLLVVDDASTDPAIRALLDSLAGHRGVRVVRNETNLGYTRTANLGCRLAGRDDVLLLNSDTVVGPHWLRNLKLAAYAKARTGTVTAVSDNAGAFSVPRPGANGMPAGLGVTAWSRAVADVGAPAFEAPTGNGFCLYLRRAMLDAVGTFDEDAFPVGYGEENDLCMRALSAGWHHLVAPTVFVHHARSASFGERRDALAQAGAARLEARHPQYAAAVEGVARLSGFVLARHRIARRYRALEAGARSPRQRIAYVLSTRDGGVPQANADLMRALAGEYDCLALRSDRGQVEVLALGDEGYDVVEAHPLPEPVGFATHVSGSYEDVVRAILVRHSVDLLHIRHLAWHSLNLADVARGLGIAVVQSFHDYYSVCPTVNLVDDSGRFHPKGVTGDACPALWSGDPAAAHPVDATSLAGWQRRMQLALAPVDAFVTSSDSARQLLRAALPVLDERAGDFHVIPHGRDFPGFRSLADGGELAGDGPLRILLPGNIGRHKGAALVAELAGMAPEGLLEFHLLGTAGPELKPFVVDHGSYARDDFLQHVAAIRPHLAAVLSLAPETWCHTLTECWAAGLPVVAIDRGAVGERIRRHGGGWLLPAEAAAIHARLLALRGQPDERRARIAEVQAWQGTEGRANGTRTMAARYVELYERVLRSHGIDSPSDPGRQSTH